MSNKKFALRGDMFARFVAVATLVFGLVLTFAVLRVPSGQAQVKAGQMPKDKLLQQTFSATDGKKFNLGSSRGKVVVVHFLGTWCGYSKRQVAAINKLIGDTKDDGLEVIGMSVKDPRSNTQAVKQFINDQKVNYSVVGEVDDKYFVDFVNSTDVSVPQTLVYGRDGRLVAHYKGFNAEVGTAIEDKVKSGLALK